MVLARAALVVLALITCGWFVIGIRQTHDLDAATAIASSSPKLTAAQARHAGSLLHIAGQLNPDRQVDIVRAHVLLERGDRRGAERILMPVVRSEPKNAVAWQWVARSAPSVAVFSAALVRVAALVPRVPPPP